MVTVMNSNSTVRAAQEGRLCASTSNIVHENPTTASAKVGIGVGYGTWGGTWQHYHSM